MKFGVFLPISGRATGPDTLTEAARSAETLGFDAVWAADRVVTPWQINTGQAIPGLVHLPGFPGGRD